MKPLEHADPVRSTRAEGDSQHVAVLSRMNHDMRSPLSVILGVLELLDDSADLGDDEHRYLQLGRDAANALAHHADALRLYAGMSRGAVSVDGTSLDLFESSREALDTALAQRRATLTAEAPENPVRAEGDLGYLSVALASLARHLVSGLSGVDDDAEVAFRLRVEARDGRAWLYLDPARHEFDNDVETAIATPGGIETSVLNAIRLIEMMHGHVALDDAGTRLVIDLPVSRVRIARQGA